MKALSYENIECLAESYISEFHPDFNKHLVQVNIMDFSTSFLGLTVKHDKLSDDGSILGLTAFDDTMYIRWEGDESQIADIRKGTVVIDSSLLQSKSKGRERFTLAHECAHQILHQDIFLQKSKGFRVVDTVSALIVFRKFRTNDDWIEWQANAMAAALLMPREQIKRAVYVFSGEEQLNIKNRKIPVEIHNRICYMAEFFGVSKEAMLIRLKQLNLINGYQGSNVNNVLDIYKT